MPLVTVSLNSLFTWMDIIGEEEPDLLPYLDIDEDEDVQDDEDEDN